MGGEEGRRSSSSSRGVDRSKDRDRGVYVYKKYPHQYRMTWGDTIDQRYTNKDKERSIERIYIKNLDFVGFLFFLNLLYIHMQMIGSSK